MLAAPIDVFLGKLYSAVLNPLIGLIIAISVVVFIWGVVEFIWKSDDEETRSKGAQHILWGLVGLFIMICAIAIKNVITGTVNTVLK